ncbi:flagellar hook-basal body complex protein FliE [Halodurantibacterium flavum]|uniref:Flagellar hook-basal body complex protein FliE n=1 Tax=Halodurantibacterium flavum TaxID=1382802 RepID=A0ABW4S801_9RHOB
MDAKAVIAAQSYVQARPATAPGASSGGLGPKFAEVARDFAETLSQGEQTAKSALLGEADPHALVQALAATELAVETAVTIRDKVVEAYQEILRMPV